MKKVIGIFLLVVLAVQVLPVKQVGSLLMSNQLQEEIPHSMENDVVKKMEIKSDYFEHDFPEFSFTILPSEEFYFLYSEQIPHNHSCEILVPPPNC